MVEKLSLANRTVDGPRALGIDSKRSRSPLTTPEGSKVEWHNRLDDSPRSIREEGSFEGYRIRLSKFEDERGSLSVIETNPQLPELSRVFFVYGSTLKSRRGDHSHLECTQLLIASSGWTDVYVESPQRNFFCVRIDDPSFGLLIPPKHWACQYCRSNESVLTVLASHQYSENDYIREYAKWETTLLVDG